MELQVQPISYDQYKIDLMKIKRKLLPGQPGTKQWLEKYGQDLVCVRYRYDKERRRKLTTVEIIVEESTWEKNPQRIPANKIMYIRVNYGEVYIAKLVKAAGGRWNKGAKLWELAYKDVLALGLEDRIVDMSNIRHIKKSKPS